MGCLGFKCFEVMFRSLDKLDEERSGFAHAMKFTSAAMKMGRRRSGTDNTRSALQN
jgi:hypothetical protein